MQPLAVFAQSNEKRNQLEELFIWKMSDELKLSSTEEKKFTEIVKNLNKKKADLNKALQEGVTKMGQATTSAKKNEEFNSYKKNLSAYNKVSEEELDKLKPLLGLDRTIQYLQFKQDISNRIKATLANPDAPMKVEKKTLPTPKVIVE
jgi:hypothetical protein